MVRLPARCAASKLFFHSTDGQNLAAKSDLARHRHITADGDLGQRADQRRRQSDSRRGAIFGNGAFGDVDVNIEMPVEIRIESQQSGA